MKRIMSIIILAAMASLPALAEDKSDGCGVGNYVTGKKSLLGTTTRGTTNYFLPPTFSMTSGTSNCDRHSIAKNEEPTLNYTVTNKDMLLIEMAAGEGEYLQGLARSFGCSAAVTERFGHTLQQNYEGLQQQGARSGIEMYKGVRKTIREDRVLSTNCKVIG